MQKTTKGIGKKQPGIIKRSMTSASDIMLRHMAFDNSLQANIITIAGTGKIILANNAACKLLGYSKKEILTKTRAAIFDIKESSFKKMLKERNAEGHSIARVTAIKKGGKKISCEITSSLFTGEHGIKQAIFTITDLSQSILDQKNIDTKKEKIVADNIALVKAKQKTIDAKNVKRVAADIKLAQSKSDTRLAENNEWVKYIATTSYDVMWDWDIATGEIYAGDSVEEVFGYLVQNNKVSFTDFIGCLLPEEKDTVEKKLWETLAAADKSWNDSFMFKRQDGSIAAATSRACIVRDEEGKAIRLIGAIQDVSRVQELEKNLEKQNILHGDNLERFNEVAKLSFDVIWDWNIVTGEVFRGQGFEKLLGYPVEEYKGDISDWNNHIHPDDKEAVEKKIHDFIVSPDLNCEYAFRFIRADGTIANVFNRVRIIRDANGRACRMIGVLHDLSRQKN